MTYERPCIPSQWRITKEANRRYDHKYEPGPLFMCYLAFERGANDAGRYKPCRDWGDHEKDQCRAYRLGWVWARRLVKSWGYH